MLQVSYAIGVDSRIGRKGIQASVGYGGTCYETHLRNLVYLAQLYRLQPVATYWEQARVARVACVARGGTWRHVEARGGTWRHGWVGEV